MFSKTFLLKITSKRRLLFLALLTNFLIHLPFLQLPPCSIHVWRQCNTLAVARNFYEEDMNILKPRVDRRLDTDGVTGMQFPAYEWLVACLYKLFGEHFIIARVFSLFLFSMSIVCVYGILLETISSSSIASIAAWSFCWSPELFYHGINALPDILALTSGLAAILSYLKWRREKKIIQFIFSLLMLTLAGLVKLQYLMFGAFVFVIACRDFLKDRNKKYFILIISAGIISVFLTISWYNYALKLIAENNLHDFGIEFRPEKNIDKALIILKKNLISDLPELLLNYAGTLLFILGIAAFFKNKMWKHFLFFPLLITTVIYISYHLIELGQMDVHHYYMLPAFLIFIFVMSYGVKFMAEKKMFFMLMIILIAQPVLAAIRILPARWLKADKAVPAELFNDSTRNILQTAVPEKSLVLAGPDVSGCIYFYLLHKKGFGYNDIDYLNQKNSGDKLYIEDCIERGTKYIYIRDTTILNDSILQPFLDNEIKTVGSFKVYFLKKK